MSYDNLIEWLEDNVDIEEESMQELVLNIKNYNEMSKTKQQNLKNALQKAFKKKVYKFRYARISKQDRKKYKTAYKTKKGYYYARKRKAF